MQLSLKSANFFQILFCFILVWGLWQGISYSRISCKWFIASSKGQYLAVNVVIFSMIWLELLHSCMSRGSTNLLMRNLSNAGGDGNENGKNAIGLISKTTTLHMHHAFLFLSLLSLHDWDVKLPNFLFYGRCWHEAKFWFALHVSKYFLTCARQRDLLNHIRISMIQK